MARLLRAADDAPTVTDASEGAASQGTPGDLQLRDKVTELQLHFLSRFSRNILVVKIVFIPKISTDASFLRKENNWSHANAVHPCELVCPLIWTH